MIGKAAAGDTIRVEGTVREGSIHVDRPLVLIGGANAVIDGTGKGDALRITADNVTVRASPSAGRAAATSTTWQASK
ncbi:MAG: hypothetical protein IPF41_06705 [Flavobacteriales bacterium]|nr:hypothetical protein [Flavobacteriales bacterium]